MRWFKFVTIAVHYSISLVVWQQLNSGTLVATNGIPYSVCLFVCSPFVLCSIESVSETTDTLEREIKIQVDYRLWSWWHTQTKSTFSKFWFALPCNTKRMLDINFTFIFTAKMFAHSSHFSLWKEDKKLFGLTIFRCWKKSESISFQFDCEICRSRIYIFEMKYFWCVEGERDEWLARPRVVWG